MTNDIEHIHGIAEQLIRVHLASELDLLPHIWRAYHSIIGPRWRDVRAWPRFGTDERPRGVGLGAIHRQDDLGVDSSFVVSIIGASYARVLKYEQAHGIEPAIILAAVIEACNQSGAPPRIQHLMKQHLPPMLCEQFGAGEASPRTPIALAHPSSSVDLFWVECWNAGKDLHAVTRTEVDALVNSVSFDLIVDEGLRWLKFNVGSKAGQEVRFQDPETRVLRMLWLLLTHAGKEISDSSIEMTRRNPDLDRSSDLSYGYVTALRNLLGNERHVAGGDLSDRLIGRRSSGRYEIKCDQIRLCWIRIAQDRNQSRLLAPKSKP